MECYHICSYFATTKIIVFISVYINQYLCHFWIELIKIPLQFVPYGPINNIPALVHFYISVQDPTSRVNMSMCLSLCASELALVVDGFVARTMQWKNYQGIVWTSEIWLILSIMSPNDISWWWCYMHNCHEQSADTLRASSMIFGVHRRNIANQCVNSQYTIKK